jgi:hypothetical protein
LFSKGLKKRRRYGMMDHEEATRKHTGGKVVGFFF